METLEDKNYILDGEKPLYGKIGRGGWDMHYNNKERTTISGYDNDKALLKMLELGIPACDTRTILEEDIVKTINLPLIALDGKPSTTPYEIGVNLDTNTLENVFTQYGNLGAETHNINLPNVTYDRELRQKEISATESIEKAIKNKDWEEVEKLAKEGYADLEVRDWHDRTVLNTAITYGASFKTVKVIIDEGADINAKDKFGWSSIARAAHNIQDNMVDYLLEKDAVLTDNVIFMSILNNPKDIRDRMNITKKFLDKGVNINHMSNVEETILMMLVKVGDLDAIKTVVEHGAKIGVENRHFESAYTLALRNKSNSEIANYLQEQMNNEVKSDTEYVLTDKTRIDVTMSIEKGDIQVVGEKEADKKNDANYEVVDYEHVLKSGTKFSESSMVALTEKGVNLLSKLEKTSNKGVLKKEELLKKAKKEKVQQSIKSKRKV